jgi:hypothetical protein
MELSCSNRISKQKQKVQGNILCPRSHNFYTCLQGEWWRASLDAQRNHLLFYMCFGRQLLSTRSRIDTFDWFHQNSVAMLNLCRRRTFPYAHWCPTLLEQCKLLMLSRHHRHETWGDLWPWSLSILARWSINERDISWKFCRVICAEIGLINKTGTGYEEKVCWYRRKRRLTQFSLILLYL